MTDPNPEHITVQAPPNWKVDRKITKEAASFTIQVPADTKARHVPIALRSTLPNDNSKLSGELRYVLPVRGRLATQLFASATSDGQPGVRLQLRNNGQTDQVVQWAIELNGAAVQSKGKFNIRKLTQTEAHLAGTAEGEVIVPASGTINIDVPIARTNDVTLYQVASVVTTQAGRRIENERMVGGFLPAVRATEPITLDGKLDESLWQHAIAREVNDPRQVHGLKDRGFQWDGPGDLSASIRAAWDESHFYLGVIVTDDVLAGTRPALWARDGLQLLIDPARSESEPAGKYDYGIALTEQGPAAAAYLSANPNLPVGPVTDFGLGIHHDETANTITYEVAIPWQRLAPFRPGAHENLGLHIAFNEDDGQGRYGFLSWFGDIQNKDLDSVGDVILLP